VPLPTTAGTQEPVETPLADGMLATIGLPATAVMPATSETTSTAGIQEMHTAAIILLATAESTETAW
jgi:hypothetical protein